MNLKLKVWKQEGPDTKGYFKNLEAKEVSPDMSFLEMLDVVNQDLIKKGDEPIAFDHDCREGICGSCSMVVNGDPHGPEKAVTVCQLHMRKFKDGDSLVIEPWRAKAFPIVKDLITDRSAFDRIIQAGGYISVNTGNAPEANSIPVPKVKADAAFQDATCIGCGACVAACKNASAMLFTAAKISHLEALPQGKVESQTRVLNMIGQMDKEKFGACTNTGACSAVCPKEISLKTIAKANSLFRKAAIQKS